MSNYVKLYESFWRSSMRDEPPYTRLLFLALLSLADENGVVHATNKFLADFAVIPVEQVAESIERLQQPDPESTSNIMDGRRIVKYGESPNRWLIVNYRKYYARSRQEERAEYKAEWIKTKRHARTGVDSSRQVSTSVDSVDSVDTKLNLNELNLNLNPPIVPPCGGVSDELTERVKKKLGRE